MSVRLLAAVALSTLLVLPAGAEARAKKRPCSATGSTTLLANKQARVFELDRDGDLRIYGCLYRTDRRRFVASYIYSGGTTTDESRPGLWLTGSYVAFNDWVCAPSLFGGGCQGRAGAVNVRTGSRTPELDTGGSVRELVLRPNGSFALISGGAVRKLDAEGEVLLDPGPAHSLALSELTLQSGASRLYWVRDAQPQFGLLR